MILSRVDHTILQPTATASEVEQACREAVRFRTASACIPPCYVAQAHRVFGAELNVCTVVGYPLGSSAAVIKAQEASLAVSDGASEIEMVVNLSAVRGGDFDAVSDEIREIRAACRGRVLKVIVEAGLLTAQEKTRLCRIASSCGADYLTTSTGFRPPGASLEDVRLMQRNAAGVKVKAAGGIRTLSDMEAFLAAGCERIGTSNAIRLLRELGVLPQ